MSAIFDSALFKVFDGSTKNVVAATGLVPSSVPLLAWENRNRNGVLGPVLFTALCGQKDVTVSRTHNQAFGAQTP